DLNRFLREARSVAQLRHPSIVSVYGVGREDQVPYLVSEFVQGITLADLLSACRLSPRESARLIATIADALQYAHDKGLIDSDVKPANVMLRTEKAGGRKERKAGGEAGEAAGPTLSGLHPLLTDFGLAKRDGGEGTVTEDGQVLGTPAYMSPEQARGETRRVDGRSDVYSLGVILYEMLTGELPFRGTARMMVHQVLHEEPRPPRSLNRRLPRDLETICLKALAKEPQWRYQTTRDLAADLRRFLAGEPIRARPVNVWERGWRWAQRRPAVAGLLT